jgi:hypothetical protein
MSRQQYKSFACSQSDLGWNMVVFGWVFVQGHQTTTILLPFILPSVPFNFLILFSEQIDSFIYVQTMNGCKETKCIPIDKVTRKRMSRSVSVLYHLSKSAFVLQQNQIRNRVSNNSPSFIFLYQDPCTPSIRFNLSSFLMEDSSITVDVDSKNLPRWYSVQS